LAAHPLVAAALSPSQVAARSSYAADYAVPPFTDQPALLAWRALGVAEEVLAAIGVYFSRAWGRRGSP
jgi:hypothetical protein